MSQPDCPNVGELVDYTYETPNLGGARGALDLKAVKRISDHVIDCESCRIAIELSRKPDESLKGEGWLFQEVVNKAPDIAS